MARFFVHSVARVPTFGYAPTLFRFPKMKIRTFLIINNGNDIGLDSQIKIHKGNRGHKDALSCKRERNWSFPLEKLFPSG